MNFQQERTKALKLCSDADWQQLQDGFYNESALEFKAEMDRIDLEEQMVPFAKKQAEQRAKRDAEPSFLEVQRAAQRQSAKEDWAQREAMCESQSKILREQQKGYSEANMYD